MREGLGKDYKRDWIRSNGVESEVPGIAWRFSSIGMASEFIRGTARKRPKRIWFTSRVWYQDEAEARDGTMT